MIWASVPLVPGQQSLPLLLTAVLDGHPHCQDSALAQDSSSPDFQPLCPLSPWLARVHERQKALKRPQVVLQAADKIRLSSGPVAGPALAPALGEPSKAEPQCHLVVGGYLHS